MSRSYKRHPWCGDKKGKSKKAAANSKVRMYLKNLDNILKYGAYKKLYESWDICDYGWLYSWNKYWEQKVNFWYRFDKKWGKPFPDKKKVKKEWYKYYKMK